MTDSKALIERLRSGRWLGETTGAKAANYIEKLEAELDRCRKSNVVMDNTVRELEADNARLRERLAKYDELKAGIVGSRAALQETSHDG